MGKDRLHDLFEVATQNSSGRIDKNRETLAMLRSQPCSRWIILLDEYILVKFGVAWRINVGIFRLPGNIYTYLSRYMTEFLRFQVFTYIMIDWYVVLLSVMCWKTDGSSSGSSKSISNLFYILGLAKKDLLN
jgi:hypothetical protein